MHVYTLTSSMFLVMTQLLYFFYLSQMITIYVTLLYFLHLCNQKHSTFRRDESGITINITHLRVSSFTLLCSATVSEGFDWHSSYCTAFEPWHIDWTPFKFYISKLNLVTHGSRAHLNSHPLLLFSKYLHGSLHYLNSR